MNTRIRTFDATELSSRKLWQLVTDAQKSIGEQELKQAVRELTERRRYLEELHRIGKLESH